MSTYNPGDLVEVLDSSSQLYGQKALVSQMSDLSSSQGTAYFQYSLFYQGRYISWFHQNSLMLIRRNENVDFLGTELNYQP